MAGACGFLRRVAVDICVYVIPVNRVLGVWHGLNVALDRNSVLAGEELSPKEVVRKFSLDFLSPPAFKFLSHGNENLLGIRPWFGLEGVEEAMIGFSKPVIVIRTYCTGRNKC